MFKAIFDGIKQGSTRAINEYKASESYAKNLEMKKETEIATAEFKAAWSELKAMNKRIASELKEEWNK
jgi:hypothetical protein